MRKEKGACKDMEHIVFLDRNLLQAKLRIPSFEHRWQEYASTRPDEVVERLQGATIAITTASFSPHRYWSNFPPYALLPLSALVRIVSILRLASDEASSSPIRVSGVPIL
jgi:hypothetical protein